MAQLEVQRSEDWMIIKRDDEVVYRGHGADARDWVDILESFGISVLYQYGQHGRVDDDGFHDGDDSTFIPDN